MLFYICQRRRRNRQKPKQDDTEKGGSDKGSEASAAAKPGFFSRLRKGSQSQPIPVEATAHHKADSREPESTRQAGRTRKPISFASPIGFVGRVLRGQPRSPPTPLTPARSDRSNLSDRAARAAQKYRSASQENLDVRAAREATAGLASAEDGIADVPGKSSMFLYLSCLIVGK